MTYGKLLHHLRRVFLLLQIANKRQHKNLFLGMAWSLIPAAVQVLTIAFFASFLLKQSPDTMIMNLIGNLSAWNFIVSSINAGSMSLIDRGDILKKTKVEKTWFICADVLTHAYTLLYSFYAMYLTFTFISPSYFTWRVIFVPLVILPLIVSVVSMSIVMGYLTPYIRDLSNIARIILNILYWSLPIVYPYSLIPEDKRIFWEFHPLFLLMNPVRIIVGERSLPSLFIITKSILVACISVILGYFVHKKFGKRVIYYL